MSAAREALDKAELAVKGVPGLLLRKESGPSADADADTSKDSDANAEGATDDDAEDAEQGDDDANDNDDVDEGAGDDDDEVVHDLLPKAKWTLRNYDARKGDAAVAACTAAAEAIEEAEKAAAARDESLAGMLEETFSICKVTVAALKDTQDREAASHGLVDDPKLAYMAVQDAKLKVGS